MAREQADGGKRTVYTDGPLIHNNQMMPALGKEGVREVGDYQSSSAIELADEEREVIRAAMQVAGLVQVDSVQPIL